MTQPCLASNTLESHPFQDISLTPACLGEYKLAPLDRVWLEPRQLWQHPMQETDAQMALLAGGAKHLSVRALQSPNWAVTVPCCVGMVDRTINMLGSFSLTPKK